ncbi:MAG: methylated-DNA--[protein]-cysteine S-methyltransferase [Thermoguttaceae bacterium]|jgi:methylated-DNA-[protein]-cysteine S-methyltransferase
MNKQEKQYWLVVFPSSLGWFAILGEKDRIKELAFGRPSARAAKKALTPGLLAQARPLSRKPPLVRRLQAYAKGASRDDFRDIKLDLGQLSVFQRQVLEECRKIPFGTTLKYGQLAARAGSHNAYRAVGNCMAGNRIPIIIPCHRVVSSSGGLGSYSAPGGMRMKKRLLSIENPALGKAF